MTRTTNVHARRAAAAVAVTLAATLTLAGTPAASGEPSGARVVVSTFPEDATASIVGGPRPPDTAPETQTVGQTIRVPQRAAQLRSFTFNLFRRGPGSALRAYVFRWDAPHRHVYGKPLYRSDIIDIKPAQWARVRFDTGRLQLSPGRRYVLFVSFAEDGPRKHTYASFGLSGHQDSQPSTYGPGQVVAQSGFGTERWRGHSWRRIPAWGDMAFQAVFTR